MALKLKMGDTLRLKKPHPCGGRLWTVARLGADIGIQCAKCGRHALIPRSRLEPQVKEAAPQAAALHES